MTSEALKLSYSDTDTYRGIVYVMTLDKKTNKTKEYACWADELESKLIQWGVYKMSSLHIYISKNEFMTFKGRKDNLFSLHNMVMDIDYKDPAATTFKYTVMHSLSLTIIREFKERNMPLPNLIHFTGNGIQLGWSFEQASSKLLWPYKIMLCNYATILKDIIVKEVENYPELSHVKVDDVANNNVIGYRRLFNTYNPEAEKMGSVVIQRSERYQIQELLDAVKQEGKLKFPKELKVTNNKSHKTSTVHVSEWNSFYIQNRKRMVLIENLIVDRNAPEGAETRNNYLFIYYVAVRGIYNQEMTQHKAKQLNNKFKKSLKSLDYIFREIDKRYEENEMYWFTNQFIITWFNMTETEQERYNFKPSMLGDFAKYIKEREEERKQKRAEKEKRDTNIISLYLSGSTQKEIAKELGCHENTVRNVLNRNKINRKDETIKQIQLLKAEGMTQAKVAESLDLCLRTVKSYWNCEVEL